MTAEKKDNQKEEITQVNAENIVVKKKAGRPKKIEGAIATTKDKVVKEKKVVKKSTVKKTSTKKVDKKPIIIKPLISAEKPAETLYSDGPINQDSYSDDEEIAIKINIKGKIQNNIDELIATSETLGTEKPVENITATTPAETSNDADNGASTSPVEAVIAESNKIEAKKDVVVVVPDAAIKIDEKIIESATEEQDGLWNVESDAVKKVIAAANAAKTDAENAKKVPETPVIEHENNVFKLSSHAIGIYKKIAYFFALLLMAVGAAVFYFTFIHVKIVLIPSQERISNNAIFDVLDAEKNQNVDEAVGEKVIGVVKETAVSFSKTYPATNEEVLGKEVIGKVRLVNNYIKNQPLVASTRLLSTDGKLFRLKNTVDIPVNGSVEAEIYADDSSPEMAIGASKFTIPGLWAGLQDKIYAESSEAAIYQQKVKKSISEDDIRNGVKDLKQELLNNAKKEVNDSYSNYDKIIYKIDENSIITTVNNKVGEEISEFQIGMEAKVVVVAFSNKIFAEIAKDKLMKSLADNKELVSFDSENINYSLNNFNVENGTANVGASFEGMVTLKDNSNVIDKEKLIGLNKDQVNAYLNDIDKTGNLDLAGHEIQFYPSFITKIPALIEPGRIEIEIRK
ncbi:hypothetical protein L6270_03625 [Candidatus Parcubacteria bacterium]|nr:hypothetical protein [Patescibacteria group bacterium]MBU4309054.1 hypothetical protein [Patescibacteria group bacterium]MBU4432431.1 hypothetical protein [Patescibacteria group bacterium]MBU4577415.1 hypothetical protein [Patescibacteria group bacterium]MCG2697103.1 hypothetical protein [Candidatus Parcubacteria bacterium]